MVLMHAMADMSAWLLNDRGQSANQLPHQANWTMKEGRRWARMANKQPLDWQQARLHHNNHEGLSWTDSNKRSCDKWQMLVCMQHHLSHQRWSLQPVQASPVSFLPCSLACCRSSGCSTLYQGIQKDHESTYKAHAKRHCRPFTDAPGTLKA